MMLEPVVVNIHKHKRERPGYDIYIGRATRYTEFTKDSKWCNPFQLSRWDARAMPMFEVYARSLVGQVIPQEAPGWDALNANEQHAVGAAWGCFLNTWGKDAFDLSELTSKTLGCWCKPAKCHGDVLVKLWRERHG